MSAEEFKELFLRFKDQEGENIKEANDQIGSMIETLDVLDTLIELLSDENLIISKMAAISLNSCIMKNSATLTQESSSHFIEHLFTKIPNLPENVVNIFEESMKILINIADCGEMVFQFVKSLAENGQFGQLFPFLTTNEVISMEEHLDEFIGILDAIIGTGNSDYVMSSLYVAVGLCLVNEKNERIGEIIEHFSDCATSLFNNAVHSGNMKMLYALFSSFDEGFSENVNLFPIEKNIGLVQEVLFGSFPSRTKYHALELFENMVKSCKTKLEPDKIAEFIEMKLTVSAAIFADDPEYFDGGSGVYLSLLSLLTIEQAGELVLSKLQVASESKEDMTVVAPIIDLLFNVPEWYHSIFNECFSELTELLEIALTANIKCLNDVVIATIMKLTVDSNIEYLGSINAKELLDVLFSFYLENVNPNAIAALVKIIQKGFESSDDFFEEYFNQICEVFQTEANPNIYRPISIVLDHLIRKFSNIEAIFSDMYTFAGELIGSDSDDYKFNGLYIIHTLTKLSPAQIIPLAEEILAVLNETLKSEDNGVLEASFNILSSLAAILPEEMNQALQEYIPLTIGFIENQCETDVNTLMAANNLESAFGAVLSLINIFPTIISDSDILAELHKIVIVCIDSISCYNVAARFWIIYLRILSKEKIFPSEQTFEIFQNLMSKINKSESVAMCSVLTDMIYNLFLYLRNGLNEETSIILLDSLFSYISAKKRDIYDDTFIENPSNLIRTLLISISDKEKRAAYVMENIDNIIKMMEFNEATASLALAFLYPVISYAIPDELACQALQIAIKHCANFGPEFQKNAAYFILNFSSKEEVTQESVESIIELLENVYSPSNTLTDNLVTAVCNLHMHYNCLSTEQIAAVLAMLPPQKDGALLATDAAFYEKISSELTEELVIPLLKSIVSFLSHFEFEEITKSIDAETVAKLCVIIAEINESNPGVLEDALQTETDEERKRIIRTMGAISQEE